MLIFGGNDGNGNVFIDVWRLSNATGWGTPVWTQLNPTGGPPPARNSQVAVFDFVATTNGNTEFAVQPSQRELGRRFLYGRIRFQRPGSGELRVFLSGEESRLDLLRTRLLSAGLGTKRARF